MYRYAVDLVRSRDGRALGTHPLVLDLAPAIEWVRLRALQAGMSPARLATATIGVEPEWHAQAGAPYVEGVRVTACAGDAPAVTVRVPSASFHGQVRPLGAALVTAKELEAGEAFTYTLMAYAETARPTPPDDGLDLEDVPVPIPLQPGSLAELEGRSTAHGDTDPELIPVFLAAEVVAEAAQLTEDAQELEVGSILLGHLRQDAAAQRIFLEVTGQIPARHTLSESTRLSFTSETWAAAQAAIALRRRGEQMVGWFHSHPARYWCRKECAPEAKRACPLGRSFFSAPDCDVQRTCFLPAYCIGLLITHSFGGMKLAMFSWKHAAIVQRGFHIIRPVGAGAAWPRVEAEAVLSGAAAPGVAAADVPGRGHPTQENPTHETLCSSESNPS